MRHTRAGAAMLLATLILTACTSPSRTTERAPVPVTVPRDTGSQPQPDKPATPSPPVPPAAEEVRRAATVRVEQRHGHDWHPVTLLNAHSPAGPAELRVTFTKPVNRQEVERALSAAQSAPVRGLMQWLDDQTLIWSIAELPPRIDFLLGGAHDQDGLPLPGGLPSLRVGDTPSLVAVNLANGQEEEVARLPGDISTATLTPDGKNLALQVWVPGATRWDWELTDMHVSLATGTLTAGGNGVEPPRLRTELENWVVSPQGSVGVGVLHSDLVLADLRGGRQQTFRDVINRYTWAHGEMPVDLVWAADGSRVVTLSVKSQEPPFQDLIAVAIPSGERSVLVPDLPLGRAYPRLAWAPDERYMLVGNLLVDIPGKRVTALSSHTDEARGVWAPEGAQLLYTAKDWDEIMLLDPTSGQTSELGRGLIAGWADPERVYLIRWPASDTRYVPAGQ